MPVIDDILEPFTCNLSPVKRGGGGGARFVPPPTVCFRRQRNLQGELIPCPSERIHYGLSYKLISSDEKQCCYKR